jgi:hypothetical protein
VIPLLMMTVSLVMVVVPCSKLYGGVESHFLAGYPMSSETQVASTLEDFICQHGPLVGLKSDNAKSELGQGVVDLEHMYCIKDKQSKPHFADTGLSEWSEDTYIEFVETALDIVKLSHIDVSFHTHNYA